MAKFELVKKTYVNGDIWYHITKDGFHVNETYTKNFDVANDYFEKFTNGQPSETIIETLKTKEIDEIL